ncbi:twin-arginine translocation signal domain-containing protein [Halalkalicoccus salilacus]|uniref:twin-arginine translocation signal domain-containing protein n=1 Tax=Halalkalicoccus TaxID=332246 RepID=UPI002F9634E2
MTEEDQSEQTRRTFVKGAAATGVAATGVTAFSGGAAAQPQNIRNLNVNLTDQNGLVNVNVQNVNVLNNVNVEDIVVTVIGGDVEVLNNLNVNIEDIDVNIENVLSDILNDSVVQVAVLALNGSGDAVAAGSDALNL